jgi:drug/metabolite transporter superfamily protein YnfA
MQARGVSGHTMMEMLPFLLLAAALEIGGDAAFRYGLVRPAWPWLLVGGTMLVAYGLAVNVNRSVDFGRLMGVYIALFFLVSQVISWTAFGERPSATLIVGGTLIVAGGLVIQAGMP